MNRLLDRVDTVVAHASLGERAVNFRPGEVDRTWRRDVRTHSLGWERPGPPEQDGLWQTACRALAAYELSDPRLVRAVYRPEDPLEGRNMLLEGRWLMLRFYMGVRVTSVIDETRDAGQRVWGWGYETLEGHLEHGRMTYEVVKHQQTGEVELVLRTVSRGEPTMGRVLTLGWRLFGRRRQLRFYRACESRLAAFVVRRSGLADPVPPRRRCGGLVLAPSDARRRRWDVLSVRPGQPR